MSLPDRCLRSFGVSTAIRWSSLQVDQVRGGIVEAAGIPARRQSTFGHGTATHRRD
jgi:hypothetical protein